MEIDSVPLDFEHLDNIAYGIARERFAPSALPAIEAQMLGPVIESLSLAEFWNAPDFRDLTWYSKGTFGAIIDDIQAQKTRSQMTGVKTGWICADQIFDGTHWTGFHMRVSSAIKSGGFDDHTKAGVVAMLKEFRSNIADHADRNDGCLAAFHSSEGAFEVMVADRGRGVLQSLRENPNYADLMDAGVALRQSVTDGVSRHADPLRGHGFRDLFHGLANRFSHIRLRSGDHALEIFRNASNPPIERVSQKTNIPGLFVYARFDKH